MATKKRKNDQRVASDDHSGKPDRHVIENRQRHECASMRAVGDRIENAPQPGCRVRSAWQKSVRASKIRQGENARTPH